MRSDLPSQDNTSTRPVIADPEFGLRVSRARHDLNNAIGQILGFSEMLLEEIQEQGRGNLRPELELIHRNAGQMIAQTDETLQTAKIESGRADPLSLQRQLCALAARILAALEILTRKARALEDDVFKEDLSRIGAATRHAQELASTSLGPLRSLADKAQPPAPLARSRIASPDDPARIPAPPQTRHEGFILIVDDMEENRELLSRRLSPLGYSVQMADSGPRALESVAAKPPDVILLDILMPGLDGFEVLRRLKADPATQHIPVIMLSALDDEQGIARCIEMGAEDYLAKPFNPVFLRARVGACMEKKRLRDREKATYEKLLRSQKKLAGELAEAAAYVRSLLPASLSGAVQADWCFQPSAELGGDAFGYHWLDPDHLAIYLLDVCGHGVGAALLSVSVLNALRTQTLPGTHFSKPAEVLAALNRTFHMESQNNLFFTMWYGVYRPSNRELAFASGGHPPALLLVTERGARQLPVPLRTEGPVVGCLEDARYSTAAQEIPSGARLMVFSDGVFEILQGSDRAGTWKEFFESFTLPEVQNLRPDERFCRALQLRGADSLEDDFSFVELRFD
ncbi:MAG: SpoIIE family protein phosphatase [Verrucomicrobiota bacterium]|jgi:sigma-B regulation protein RsbU (phosphoserine phosphatase)